MRQFALGAALACITPATGATAQTIGPPSCATILPPTHASGDAKRALLPEDLVALRDIGPAEPQYFPQPVFALSPDGRRIAFQLRQAEPARNSYCLAMVVLELGSKGAPRIVDEGGEPLLLTIDLRGIADLPNGVLRVVTPRWSADGKWIAFLKREGGSTQVWRAFADGSGASPLTHSPVDVVDFRIAGDGSSIVYATRPGLEEQRREIEQQGLNGWHYDDRFVPWTTKRPLPKPAEREILALDPRSGKLRAPSTEEARLLSGADEFSFTLPAPARDSAGLSILASGLEGGASAGAFRARLADGSIASCAAPACEGAMHPWWMPGKTHVRFIRREGWARASTAIYDWDLRSGRVRRLYLTDALLTSCTPEGTTIICRMDSALEPGRLARLDPASGAIQALFDPNPEFAQLTLGRATRLHWSNDFGLETVADLVLPVGYRPGERYPLIVVQYDTRGFLRGGTDDEYPIQAFANRGYAVLSFKRPQFVSIAKGSRDYEQAGRADLEDFADRRSVQSSLERGVQLAIASGIADPKRIGITGLSDGSSTVEWALIHSSLFSAAAISSCCWDPMLVAEVGPSAARHFRSEGYPGMLGRNDPFWKQVSLLENANRISTPILVSASETEFLDAVPTFTALREAGVPIDLFEFPGEYHGRWQPAHRLAAYRRSLDWFDYWLRGVRSAAPDRQSELEEWDRLKREAGHGHPI